MVAQVADSYLEICTPTTSCTWAEHSLQLQKRSRTVTERLIEAGPGTPPELARANARGSLLESRAAAAARAAFGGRLFAGRPARADPGQLLGRRDRLRARAQPGAAAAVGDGRALLQRRPDVRQAERKLASATARIGVATAELYRTSAWVLWVRGLLEDFGTPMTQQWSIGPLISWTLRPPARTQHPRREAGADAALAEFRPHRAAGAARDPDRDGPLCAGPAPAAVAAHCAGTGRIGRRAEPRLYRAAAAVLSSLDADRSLATSDATLAAAEAQVSRDQIHLFLVLGGGWQASATAPKASTAAKLNHERADARQAGCSRSRPTWPQWPRCTSHGRQPVAPVTGRWARCTSSARPLLGPTRARACTLVGHLGGRPGHLLVLPALVGRRWC